MLADSTKAAFDQEALLAMKEAAVFNKPYLKKTAWVGAESFPDEFRENLMSFSRANFLVSKAERKPWSGWLSRDRARRRESTESIHQFRAKAFVFALSAVAMHQVGVFAERFKEPFAGLP
jgi:hypothetical protein